MKSLLRTKFIRAAWMKEKELKVRISLRNEMKRQEEYPYFQKCTGRELLYIYFCLGRLYISFSLTPYMRLPKLVQLWLAGLGIV